MIIEFRCPRCGGKQEVFTFNKEVEKQKCPNCDEEMERLYGLGGYKMEGKTRYKDAMRDKEPRKEKNDNSN